MAGIDVGGAVRKAFLLGVGVAATGAEKTQQVVSDMVKKGKLTVEQGKALNEELGCKARRATSDVADDLLRARLAAMGAEERAAYAQKVAKFASDLDAEAVSVEVEVDESEDGAPAAEDEPAAE